MPKKWDVYSSGTKVGELHERVDYEDKIATAIGGSLPVAVVMAIAAIFLPFYCTYRLTDRSSNALLQILGIFVGVSVWSLLLTHGKLPIISATLLLAALGLIIRRTKST